MSGWAAAGQAVGELAGAYLQAEGARDAAHAQSQAAGNALDETRRQFDLTREDFKPYREAGSAAIKRIRDLLGIGPSIEDISADLRKSGRFNMFEDPAGKRYRSLEEMHAANPNQMWHTQAFDEEAIQREARAAFENQGRRGFDIATLDPGYQFRLREGERALGNAARSGGMLKSGAALKAATRYGQDYASSEFDKVINRFAGLAGTGQTATATGAGIGAGLTGNIAGLMMGAGNARGASYIAGGNAWGNAASNIGNYYQQQQTLDKILNSKGGNNNSTYGSGSNWYNENAPS